MASATGIALWFLATLLSTQLISAQTEADLVLVSSALPKFVDALPHIPTIKGYIKRGSRNLPAKLRIGMFETTWKFHRDLNATRVFAFGLSKKSASVPGPTIQAQQGVETLVRWENHLPSHHILPWDPTISAAKPKGRGVPTVVHLHGGIVRPQSDGHPTSWFTAGFRNTGPAWSNRVYRYPNRQHPGNLWYHDHSMGLNRINILAGLFGAYVVHSPRVEAPLGLPSGPYDRHLVVSDRSFRRDGSIFINATGNNPSIHPQWQPEYFGDAVIVNGKAWPYMKVRRRKYRFRVINASNARFYRFALSNGLSFIFIGSDSAYLQKPVTVTSFLLSPSEIADIVVDFAASNSTSAVLSNSAPYPYPDGDVPDSQTASVMKFLIEKKPAMKDPSRVPDRLLNYDPPKRAKPVTKRYITMFEYESKSDEPTHLYLNGVPFEAPVTEKPREGTDEVWEVINLTDDNHPLHIHLGLASPLAVTKLADESALAECMSSLNDAVKCNISEQVRSQKRRMFPLEERGWKNVIKIEPGHLTTIVVRFSLLESPGAPYPFRVTGARNAGYVYHCHILDHEDNEMMRPMLVLPFSGNRSHHQN